MTFCESIPARWNGKDQGPVVGMSFSEDLKRRLQLQCGEAEGDWSKIILKGLDDVRPMVGQMGNLFLYAKCSGKPLGKLSRGTRGDRMLHTERSPGRCVKNGL